MRQLFRTLTKYESFTYPKDRISILKILRAERNDNLCEITESWIDDTTDQIDVCHFNPELKNTPQDNASNWIAAKTKWNKMMGTKNATIRWNDHQPILSPSENDFEDRIKYNTEDGLFYAKDEDIEANKAINFLLLNNINLVEDRKKYIEKRKKEILEGDYNYEEYFMELKKEDPEKIYFIRAIQETFNAKL